MPGSVNNLARSSLLRLALLEYISPSNMSEATFLSVCVRACPVEHISGYRTMASKEKHCERDALLQDSGTSDFETL